MCAPPPTHAAAHARPDAAHRDGLTLTIRNVIRLQALENVHTYTINTLKLNDTDYVYYHMVNIQTTAVATQCDNKKAATKFWQGRLTRSMLADVLVGLMYIYDADMQIYENATNMIS